MSFLFQFSKTRLEIITKNSLAHPESSFVDSAEVPSMTTIHVVVVSVRCDEPGLSVVTVSVAVSRIRPRPFLSCALEEKGPTVGALDVGAAVSAISRAKSWVVVVTVYFVSTEGRENF